MNPTPLRPVGDKKLPRRKKAPSHIAPPRNWVGIETASLVSGSRKYTLMAGSPVRVLGFGKKTATNPEGAAQSGWTVVSMEQHVWSGKVNVTVFNREKGRERIVPLDSLVYVRPRKV